MIHVIETGIFSTVILLGPIFQALTLQLLADSKQYSISCTARTGNFSSRIVFDREGISIPSRMILALTDAEIDATAGSAKCRPCEITPSKTTNGLSPYRSFHSNVVLLIMLSDFG
jgi:hypothetical protein